MSTSTEGLGRNLFLFSLLPYLTLSLGGQRANKIVPSYQCVFQEYVRARLCHFVLSWRASLSGLHLVPDQ